MSEKGALAAHGKSTFYEKNGVILSAKTHIFFFSLVAFFGEVCYNGYMKIIGFQRGKSNAA